MAEAENVSLYIANKELYEETIEEIRQLWFNEYSETLTKSAIVMKSILFMKQNLLEQKMVGSFENKLKISDKYGRIG